MSEEYSKNKHQLRGILNNEELEIALKEQAKGIFKELEDNDLIDSYGPSCEIEEIHIPLDVYRKTKEKYGVD